MTTPTFLSPNGLTRPAEFTVGAHESGLIGETLQGAPTQVAVGLRPKLSVFGNERGAEPKTRDRPGFPSAVPYEIVARRPGDIAACYADPSTAADLLGWRAKRGLEAMCADAWRWEQGRQS